MDEVAPGINLIAPFPFSKATYNATKFIDETLTIILDEIVKEINLAIQISWYYNDWYLKYKLPELWATVIFAFENEDNSDPPPKERIYNFLYGLNEKIAQLANLPPFTYDVLFFSELQKAIEAEKSNWPSKKRFSSIYIDKRFKQIIREVIKAKSNYIHGIEMDHR